MDTGCGIVACIITWPMMAINTPTNAASTATMIPFMGLVRNRRKEYTIEQSLQFVAEYQPQDTTSYGKHSSLREQAIVRCIHLGYWRLQSIHLRCYGVDLVHYSSHLVWRIRKLADL